MYKAQFKEENKKGYTKKEANAIFLYYIDPKDSPKPNLTTQENKILLNLFNKAGEVQWKFLEQLELNGLLIK